MTDLIPITPSVLKWARERAGFSIEEMASKSIFKNIEEWETEKSFPTYKQLEELSKKYKCPIAVFFFPEPPPLESIEKSFRTLPDTEFERIPPSIRLLILKAKAMQINLEELNEGINPAKKHIIHDMMLKSSISSSQAAIKIRNYLNVSLDEQSSWKTSAETFENWREVLFNHGIFTFKDAFKDSDFSGFCLYDEKFPIIFINNGTSKTRQIFSLFHELAHLIFKTSGIDKQHDEYLDNLKSKDRNIEIFCNRFSADFLVPDSVFEKDIEGLIFNDNAIVQLSQKFQVSREVILRKLLDRQLIEKNYYEQKSEEWSGQRKNEGTGGNYYYTQIAYLGKNYLDLAFSKYHQNKISMDQLSDFLNINLKNILKLEEKFLGRKA